MAKKKRKLTAWQRHVKSYMASHKGLSFKEALPKAKLTYRKGSKSAPNPKKKKSKGGKGGKKKMAKKKTRRRRQMTIPLALVAGAAAGAVEPVMKLLEGAPPTEVASWIVAHYTGYESWSGQFNLEQLKHGLLPLIAGAAIHKFVGGAPLNVNRMLGAAGVPLFRI